MKRILTLLVVCIALVGLKAQTVPNSLPFQFSTNTGSGAVWYIIEQDKNSSNEIRPWVPSGLNAPIGIRWSAPNPANEDELFCFVGDNTNGFYIYNKAYLAGKTVGGVSLTGDLKLQNLGVYNTANMWGGTAKLGFTTGTSITGNDLKNKFILVDGNGINHDGVARIGHYKICTTNESGTILSLRLNGSSQGELVPIDWGDIYFNTFRYVSGLTQTAPSAPTGLTATALDSKVTLAWTVSADATGYNVYRGITAGGESTTAIASNITTLSYVDNSTTNGTTYYYQVKAVNSFGTSSYSNEVSATPNLIASSNNPININFGKTLIAPAVAPNAWNNMFSPDYMTLLSDVPSKTNLIDANANPTGISIALNHLFKGVNTGGMPATTIGSWVLPSQATTESFYGDTKGAWGGIPSLTNSGFLISGLDPTLKYTFTFFSGRGSVSDNRETQFTITGSTTPTVVAINASSNSTLVATAESISPATNGTVTISITAGPNNNNGNGFYYCNAMRITPIQGLPTSIQENKNAISSEFHVYSSKGNVIITSLLKQFSYAVYNTTGQMVRTGNSSTGRFEIAMPSGIYIVKTNNVSTKIVVE